jgi:uncharacterized protein YcfL
MKKYLLLLLLAVSVVLFNGCNKEYKDERVNVDNGVKSDTALNNWFTRPFVGTYSLVAGEGIDIKEVKPFRNDADFLEVQVTGYNRAVYTKRFDYKFDWFDKDGVEVDSKASIWQTVSAKSKNTFSYKAVAPSKDVVDFKMTTRKTPE